jgi:serralysin
MADQAQPEQDDSWHFAMASNETLASPGDTITGTAGVDGLQGGPGDDWISGYGGNDWMSGGDGNDRINGGSGSDVMDGGSGVNLLSYGGSDAGVSVNLATGQNSHGDIFANFQNLSGSTHNDVLTGDAGTNVIDGGSGHDTLTGGAGADTFQFNSAAQGDQNGDGPPADTITDFNSVDKRRVRSEDHRC